MLSEEAPGDLNLAPEVPLPQVDSSRDSDKGTRTQTLEKLGTVLLERAKQARCVGHTYISSTAHVVKDATKPIVEASMQIGSAALERGTQVGSAAAHVASGVTHNTLQKVGEVREWVGTTTSATVNRATEIATTSARKVRGRVNEARSRVRQYLREGWERGPREALERVLSQGAVVMEDDDDYDCLLQFERAAEIEIKAGQTERLPFVVRAGQTVSWEFRVKDYDVGFELSERMQDYGGATEVPLIGPEKVKAGACIRGAYTSDDEKSVVLVWDNSHSFFRAKRIAFLVRVLRPEGSTEEVTLSPRALAIADTERNAGDKVEVKNPATATGEAGSPRGSCVEEGPEGRGGEEQEWEEAAQVEQAEEEPQKAEAEAERPDEEATEEVEGPPVLPMSKEPVEEVISFEEASEGEVVASHLA